MSCRLTLRTDQPAADDAGRASTVAVTEPLPPSARTEGAGPVTDDALRFAAGQRVLGSYVLDRQLGRGGMGAVFLARDEVSGQRVAVKVLPASLAREANVRERFVAEARALASLDHPGIVPLLTFAQEGDDRFLVMKFVDGRGLEHRLAHERPLPLAEVRRIVAEMCLALDYAHRRGVIHRDIKPANVLVDAGGRVVIVDFGIARSLESAEKLTRTGMLVGTPQYMSPEQVASRDLDGRSDLYACGLVLFEMLTGRPPFDGDRVFDILRAQVESAVPDVRTARAAAFPTAEPVPEDLAALVLALLHKSPDARPADGAVVAAFLEGKVTLGAPPPTTATMATTTTTPTNATLPTTAGATPASPRPPSGTRAGVTAPPPPTTTTTRSAATPAGGRGAIAVVGALALAAAVAGAWVLRVGRDDDVLVPPGEAVVAPPAGSAAAPPAAATPSAVPSKDAPATGPVDFVRATFATYTRAPAAFVAAPHLSRFAREQGLRGCIDRADCFACLDEVPRSGGTVVDATLDGEQPGVSASVKLVLGFGRQRATPTVDVVVEDGAWRIDQVRCPER